MPGAVLSTSHKLIYSLQQSDEISTHCPDFIDGASEANRYLRDLLEVIFLASIRAGLCTQVI